MIGGGNDDNDRITMMLILIRKYEGVKTGKPFLAKRSLPKFTKVLQEKRETDFAFVKKRNQL